MRFRSIGVAAALLAACSSSAPVELDRTDIVESTTTKAPTTTSTTTSTIAVPPVPGGDEVVVAVTSTGVVGVVTSVSGDAVDIVTPCGDRASIWPAETFTGAHVVIDPGHGGTEPGAVGPSGLKEKDVNLAVAGFAADALTARGFVVAFTREADYRIPLDKRAAIAKALDAQAFVSIHHNAEPDEPRDGPGTETYYQVGDPESKRLSGLIYEEVTEALDAFDVEWVADRDAGAKFRKSSSGGNYYGILRNSEGIPATLAELAFISNEPEEALLATPEFQAVEGRAIAKAVERFLITDDPGSGFVDPYPRTAPAGGGGGSAGCVDPPLGG